MKKQQWITACAGVVLVAVLYLFGRTVPLNKTGKTISPNTPHAAILTTDTILSQAKSQLNIAQATRLSALEHSVSRGDVKDQQLKVYHQLSHFWRDSARIFEPYAWYEAEVARLENSEKSLTFAAHLILSNLQSENVPELKTWKAQQAKDLFERSLKINPDNDSSVVGLGACYIFGNISESPMEGILKVRQAAERDSTNVFAQMVLGHGSKISGQYDKAIARFEKVIALQPGNLEALLSLAEVFELTGDKKSAINWYTKSLNYINIPPLKSEVEKRIEMLSKHE